MCAQMGELYLDSQAGAEGASLGMRSARYYGAHDVRVATEPVPACGDDGVLLRTIASGVCGTDAAVWTHGPEDVPEVMALMAEDPVRLMPIVAHEFPLERIDEALDAAADASRSLAVCVRMDGGGEQ